jgi:hypothetical protein
MNFDGGNTAVHVFRYVIHEVDERSTTIYCELCINGNRGWVHECHAANRSTNRCEINFTTSRFDGTNEYS